MKESPPHLFSITAIKKPRQLRSVLPKIYALVIMTKADSTPMIMPILAST